MKERVLHVEQRRGLVRVGKRSNFLGQHSLVRRGAEQLQLQLLLLAAPAPAHCWQPLESRDRTTAASSAEREIQERHYTRKRLVRVVTEPDLRFIARRGVGAVPRGRWFHPAGPRTDSSFFFSARGSRVAVGARQAGGTCRCAPTRSRRAGPARILHFRVFTNAYGSISRRRVTHARPAPAARSLDPASTGPPAPRAAPLSHALSPTPSI